MTGLRRLSPGPRLTVDAVERRPVRRKQCATNGCVVGEDKRQGALPFHDCSKKRGFQAGVDPALTGKAGERLRPAVVSRKKKAGCQKDQRDCRENEPGPSGPAAKRMRIARFCRKFDHANIVHVFAQEPALLCGNPHISTNGKRAPLPKMSWIQSHRPSAANWHACC